MKTNLIIGAGQLGSRHLQGLVKLHTAQEIYVLDPGVQALEIARQRADEIQSEAKLFFVTDWEALPRTFDLVIIATGANVRPAVTRQLLENYTVKYLVLEKVLFQDAASYYSIGNLIKETNTPTWVNHPRRFFSHYQEIKNLIREKNENIVFTVVGGNWGLACNALHFIDLFSYLAGAPVKSVDMDWVDPIIHQSKRPNNIEFTGTVKGTLHDGSNFTISSFNGSASDITVYVSTQSDRWLIQEGQSSQIIHLSSVERFKEQITQFQPQYQSDLTTSIAGNIFEAGGCNLPSFDEACSSHIPFITVAIDKYVQLSGITTLACPIT